MEKEKKKRARKQKRSFSGKNIPLPQGKLRNYAVIWALFILIIAGFAVANLVHKDQEVSVMENRSLAQKPELTWEGLGSGRYMQQYETWLSDQFVGRDFWVQLKTFADSAGGKKEENGVFHGKQGMLLEDIAVPEEKALQENLDAMKTYQEQYSDLNMHVLLVPNAAEIQSDRLPAFAVTADQSALLAQVQEELGTGFDWIDAGSTLENHKDEEIYYHTDNHWTTLGAWYVFQDAAESLGISSDSMISMEPCGVSRDFTGSLSSMSGYETGYKEPVYIYLPEGDAPQVVVNYVEEQKKTASLYDSSMLEGRDKYGVFLGGNHPLIDIKTTADSTRRLLIFKDSYANCFIPFLTPYFREILVVDPRYYTGNLEELMEQNRLTDVLFLYNGNTFFQDRMLSGVLASGSTADE